MPSRPCRSAPRATSSAAGDSSVLCGNDARRELSAERLREARQDGDLSDNPALQDLLEEQAQLERRIALLQGQLAAAEIVSPAADGRIGIGSVVRVRDDNGERFEFELVGPLESDVANGIALSIGAPVGEALVGPGGPARASRLRRHAGRSLEVDSVRPGGARPSLEIDDDTPHRWFLQHEPETGLGRFAERLDDFACRVRDPLDQWAALPPSRLPSMPRSFSAGSLAANDASLLPTRRWIRSAVLSRAALPPRRPASAASCWRARSGHTSGGAARRRASTASS